MTHAVVLDGLNVVEREQIESSFEPLGHAIRAELDVDYKRATWGRRPEDVAEQQAFIAELTGQRQR